MRDAGFADSDITVAGPSDRKQNGCRLYHVRKTVLLIGHLDVVEARREDWTTDPYKFTEKDGYYYGRGTQDMKDGDAIMIGHADPAEAGTAFAAIATSFWR